MRHRWMAALTLVLAARGSAAAGTLPDVLDVPAEQTRFALQSIVTGLAYAGKRLIAVGEYGAILYSDDEGASWRQASVPVQVMLTDVDFIDDRLGWAVGHDGVILHTEDGGATWVRQLDGRQTGALLMEAASAWVGDVQARVENAGTAEPPLQEQEAAERAVSEAQREIDIGPNRPFLAVKFLDRDHGFAVGAFGYFFETRDGGKTWVDSSSRVPNYDFLQLYGITSDGNDGLFLVGEFGLALRSRDAGATWSPINLGYEGTLFNAFTAGNSVWIVGLRGHAFHSTDGGDTFVAVDLPTSESILGGEATPEGNAVMVGTGGLLARVGKDGQEVSVQDVRSRATLAAVARDDAGNLVLAGQAGLTRRSASGTELPVDYVAGDRK